MKKIKFRFWDSTNELMMADCNGWAENVGINEMFEGLKSFEIIPMQFSGMKDKKKTEIYTGDIVEWKSGAMSGISRIGFYDGGFRLTDYVTEDNLLNEKYAKKCCKVLGNIYQNKNLLKQL